MSALEVSKDVPQTYLKHGRAVVGGPRTPDRSLHTHTVASSVCVFDGCLSVDMQAGRVGEPQQLQPKAAEGDGTLLHVVAVVACVIVVVIFVCLCRLRREEKDAMRAKLTDGRGRSSSFAGQATEMAPVAAGGAYDERPLEGLEAANAAARPAAAATTSTKQPASDGPTS